MNNLASYIEHTLLRQDATKQDLINLFEEAEKYRFYGVCIHPAYVKAAKKYLEQSGVKIVTVIGFPLGANLPEVKAFEAQKAIEDGADEIDMVINVTNIKNKAWDDVLDDIETVKKACGDKPLKVILETDLLTLSEIEKVSILCIEGRADFVKTSTGFVKGGVGAKEQDVALIAKTVKPYGLRVKASGGIRDKEQAVKMIKAGADRIGTSAGVKILQE